MVLATNHITNYRFELSIAEKNNNDIKSYDEFFFYFKYSKSLTLYNSFVYKSVNHMNMVRNKLNINPSINNSVQESAEKNTNRKAYN